MEWVDDFSSILKDRAAVRAKVEYQKAATAFQNNNHAHAAFYLGAMAHYIGDVSQYGYSVPFEEHHFDFESWVGTRTKESNSTVFSHYIELDRLVNRKPYTAVIRISKKLQVVVVVLFGLLRWIFFILKKITIKRILIVLVIH